MGRQPRLIPLTGFFDRSVHTVASQLLGGILTCTDGETTIAVRLTEVEAYGGDDDPGSHAFRGRTERNATMFGPPGHLYCYLSYGMHRLLNIVCQDPGDPAAVLLRAGEVITGHEVARARRAQRRGGQVTDRELARGPGCLGQVFAASAATDGAALTVPEAPAGWSFTPPAEPVEYVAGPRVGVSGPGGDPDAFPWRYSIPGDATVSRFVPGRNVTKAGS